MNAPFHHQGDQLASPTPSHGRLVGALGPYALPFNFLLWGLLGLSLSRIVLMAWQWRRVVAEDAPFQMLLLGLRSDLISLGWLLAPITLLLPLFVVLRRVHWWTRLSSAWLAFGLLLVLFLEMTTPQFIAEYDVRPNRLFLEYLAYPREVVAMLMDGFPVASVLATLGLLIMGWLIGRRFLGYARQAQAWPALRTLLVWPLVVLALFVMIRSSTQHRPANLASFAFCDDGMVNNLVPNSFFTVLMAAYELKNETHSSEIYGRMPQAEMVRRVRAAMGVAPQDFISDDYPTLHRQQASVRRAKPLNLVILLQESLGADFSARLGGVGVTPNLDRLAGEGIWFDQLYATGTRSVRGIEAVVAGFPPTPAPSTVKLSKSQRDFATLASLLREHGYLSEFIYGGESHFDNMRGFFLGNGFHDIVDRADFKNPAFVGDWGASDEDLMVKTDERLQGLHASGKPYFMLSFSSSNHTPFQFPDGRIELADPQKQTVNNAVKYADYAIGKFFETAKQRDYYQDTVFLVVADHDVRVYGNALMPVNKFHIPGLILGADIKPQEISSTASQIDLAPTLLSLMGVDSQHPFPGRDLTRTLPEFGNDATALPPRALMQFNDYFAWLQDGTVTVLAPQDQRSADSAMSHGVYRYRYDAKTHQQQPAPAEDDEPRANALAHSQLPAWLYQNQRYRLAPAKQ